MSVCLCACYTYSERGRRIWRMEEMNVCILRIQRQSGGVAFVCFAAQVVIFTTYKRTERISERMY